MTDARGKVTTNEYNIPGMPTQTTDAENVVTQFEYDKAGNRTLVRDGKGNETSFTYDLLNRVTLEEYANGDETSYTYNWLQKVTREDAAGTTTYTYDERDRLLTVDFPTGPDRTYAYDDAGQLLSVTESGHAAANVSYTYDLGGRALSETSRGKTHTYTYDAAGNRTSTTYDTGTSRSETRMYDAFNRITELTEGGRITGWHYDLAGRAIALSLGNGQQQDNHYDAVGKLTARHLFNPNQTLIATFSWNHDAVGNVTSQTERWLGDPARNSALRTTIMSYDDVYRLLGETVAQSGEVTKETSYTYDDASNRASKVEKENGSVVKDITYTYNAANQLTAWSEEDGEEEVLRSAVMTYDTRGNRASTAITTHGTEPTTATTTYAWTAQNMLASVTLPGSNVHSYGYDYRVRRVTRTEPGASPVAMTFSGGLSVAEFEVTDPTLGTLGSLPSVEYQRGPDMGGGVGGLLYSLRSGTPKFNLSNGRGDVVAQSNSTGDITWTASYEAYGKRPVETGSNADRQRANTKEEDPTGLLNEGYRYRDLETGVWLSRDPAGFVDGPNLYAYVRQNPWSKFDPLGLYEGQYEEGEDKRNIDWEARRKAVAGAKGDERQRLKDEYDFDRTDKNGDGRIYAEGSREMTDSARERFNNTRSTDPQRVILPAGTYGYEMVYGGALLRKEMEGRPLHEVHWVAMAIMRQGMAMAAWTPPTGVLTPAIGGRVPPPLPVPKTPSTSPAPKPGTLSTIRYTQPGETFIRYESGNAAYSRVTPGGGAKPGTYAAPASDGFVPEAWRVPACNLPSQQIPRTEVFILRPPAGTPIIGPSSVAGGTGNEVIFPTGF